MALEIERKFLVTSNRWREMAISEHQFRQAYLASSKTNSVRIRVIDGRIGRLTVKSAYEGISRDEFEYEIPVSDAIEMLELRIGGLIEKTRHRVPIDGFVWEVDVFEGLNAGLVVAEIELTCEDQEFTMPDWIGKEVSDDMRYQNSMLATSPFTVWPRTAKPAHPPTLL